MKSAKIISATLTFLVTMPIWYYILYTVLSAIHADRLVWFLYFIYIPVGFLVGVLSKIAEESK